MNENSIIMLKDDYTLFQEKGKICVYQKSTKKTILKLKNEKSICTEVVISELNRPHKVKWLAKQPYWEWLGIIMLKCPSLFDELDEKEADKYAQKIDYFSVVNRKHFAENYQLNHKFDEMRVFIWRTTVLNKLLYQEMKDKLLNLNLVADKKDTVDENSFLTSAGERILDQKIEQHRILLKDDLLQLKITQNDLFLIDATGASMEELIEINNYVIQEGAVALFYGNSLQNVIIGPLVIAGESACINCMKEQGVLTKFYTGENSFLDKTFLHLFMFFIRRILYYIKGKNLFYLLSDEQIPINKVITVSKEDILTKWNYLSRNKECKCYE